MEAENSYVPGPPVDNIARNIGRTWITPLGFAPDHGDERKWSTLNLVLDGHSESFDAVVLDTVEMGTAAQVSHPNLRAWLSMLRLHGVIEYANVRGKTAIWVTYFDPTADEKRWRSAFFESKEVTKERRKAKATTVNGVARIEAPAIDWSELTRQMGAVYGLTPVAKPIHDADAHTWRITCECGAEAHLSIEFKEVTG